MHWTHAWLGRPWQAGRFECVDLVLDVLRVQFGRAVACPPYAATARARDAQVAALADVYAAPVTAPRDGDVALMAPRGARGHGHHLGVVARVEHVIHVLHCTPRHATCLHTTATLHTLGLEVRGWHHWRGERDQPCPGPTMT